MLLIFLISFLDKTNFSMLFFFVCLSETVINYQFTYSIGLIFLFLLSRFFIEATRNGMGNTFNLIIYVLLSYGVSTVFVAGMSYLVRTQIREKEKLSRINSELEQTYKRLLESTAISQQLSIEKERILMAREIHDTLAHTLTTLIVQLEVCKKLAALDVDKLCGELEKAQELSRSGLNDIRRTVKALRPQALEGKSFFESVLDFINSTMNNTDIHIIFNNNLPEKLKFSSSLEVALFRLIQESMTNSIRHGQADEIQIDMNLENNVILINIHDNGIGCTHIKKGFGLQGIRERIEGFDGTASFSSMVGDGFGTKVTIPFKETNE